MPDVLGSTAHAGKTALLRVLAIGAADRVLARRRRPAGQLLRGSDPARLGGARTTNWPVVSSVPLPRAGDGRPIVESGFRVSHLIADGPRPSWAPSPASRPAASSVTTHRRRFSTRSGLRELRIRLDPAIE
jgi:hypothetical protein